MLRITVACVIVLLHGASGFQLRAWKSCKRSSDSSSALASVFDSFKPPKTIRPTEQAPAFPAPLERSIIDYQGVPVRGISDYIGNTSILTSLPPNLDAIDDKFGFIAPRKGQLLATKFALWRQYPWKKISGKVVLRAKVGGELALEAASPSGLLSSFGRQPEFDALSSLEELKKMLTFGALDPRVQGVFIELDRLGCGYAKLTEIRRDMRFFKESGKPIYVYMASGAEKEMFLALEADELYVPPDGGLDLRGFAAAATFVRGVFEKLGLEPQVQRIGKYKSFGDTFNRTDISDAQREVTSSLLMEASTYWARSVARQLDKPVAEVLRLWADTGIKDAYDYKELGYVTGVKYLDQVEDKIERDMAARTAAARAAAGRGKSSADTANGTASAATAKNATDIVLGVSNGDFSLTADFSAHPRRRLDNVTTLSDPPTTRWYALTKAASRSLDGEEDDDEDLVLSQVVVGSKKYLVDPLTNQVLALNGYVLGSYDPRYNSLNSSLLDAKTAEVRVVEGGPVVGTYDFKTSQVVLSDFDAAKGSGQEEDSGVMTDAEVATRLAALATETSGAAAADIQAEAKPWWHFKPPGRAGVHTGQKGLKLGGGLLANRDKAKERYSQTYYPAGLYLRKMRRGDRILSGLRVREVRGGPRVAVINAVGGINSGASGSGAMGRSLGSDTVIAQVRQAREDPSVKALVMRIDSPGGSALASDLMWREIRLCSERKPVVASMVDVAASGGYYMAMACDCILAEELTVTGSIGVVTAKFSQAELNKRIGLQVDTISRGRYAEILSTSRGFTGEEDEVFAEGALRAYTSFITKAAASRNMTVDAMNTVAQGRVWTGRQAKERGLVDRIGGIDCAVHVASQLAGMDVQRGYAIETVRERRPPSLPFPLSLAVGRARVGSGAGMGMMGMGGGAGGLLGGGRASADGLMYMADDVVAATGLCSEESLGVPPLVRGLGLGPFASALIKGSGLLVAANLASLGGVEAGGASGVVGGAVGAFEGLAAGIVDFLGKVL